MQIGLYLSSPAGGKEGGVLPVAVEAARRPAGVMVKLALSRKPQLAAAAVQAQAEIQVFVTVVVAFMEAARFQKARARQQERRSGERLQRMDAP